MKQIGRLAAVLLLGAALSGCGFKDGTYTAETAGPDSLGYQAYLTVTVTEGVIVDAKFDAQDKDGFSKAQNAEYCELMRPISGTTPQEVSAHYQELLLGAKRYDQVKPDAISGATVSSGEFARLWQALKKPLKEGTPNLVTLAPSPEYTPPAPSE